MIGAQQDFSYMDDNALQTALQFAQRSNNTPTFLALMAEAQKRKQMRQEAQGMQAGAQTAQRPSTVADQVMQGIANLDSGDHAYAGGGIVAFDDGGPVMYDAKGDPYTHLWHAEGSSDKNTPYWDSLKEAFGFPVEAIKRVIGAPNQRQYRADTPQTGQKPVTLPPTGAGGGRGSVNPPAVTPQAASAAAPTPAPGGIGSLAVSSRKTTGAAAPAEAESKPEATLTAEEIAAKARAMAKGDDDKVAAIYAKAAERDAKRREALDAETKGTKGWLGAEMSPETRKMLRDAGIAMLTSKRSDAMGGIGEGLAAAAKGYDEGKIRRQDRLDMLDAADEKRQLAQIAAQQGNMELSRKYITEAETLKQQAQGNALKKDEAREARRHHMSLEDLQRQANSIHAATANKPSDFQWGMAQLAKDPEFAKRMEQFYGSKTTTRPIDHVKLVDAYQKGIANGSIPAGTSYDDYAKMVSAPLGTGAPPSTAGYSVIRQ